MSEKTAKLDPQETRVICPDFFIAEEATIAAEDIESALDDITEQGVRFAESTYADDYYVWVRAESHTITPVSNGAVVVVVRFRVELERRR